METSSACFTVIVIEDDFPLNDAVTFAFPTEFVVIVPLSEA